MKATNERKRTPKVRVDIRVACPACGREETIKCEAGVWRMKRHREASSRSFPQAMCKPDPLTPYLVRRAMEDLQRGAATVILGADAKRAAEKERHRTDMAAIDGQVSRAEYLVRHLASAIARLDAGQGDGAARALVRGGVACAAGGGS